MTTEQAGKLVALLAAAWPRHHLARATVALYVSNFTELPYAETEAAVKRLINTRTFLPAIAEVRVEVAEAALQLPSVEEAWQIALTGSLKSAPPEVRAAADSVGGRWSIHETSNPTAVRAQFDRNYAARRDAALCVYVGGLALPPAEHFIPRENGGAPRKELPVTTQVRPRPVMARMWARLAKGDALRPPSEKEKHDAIQVMRPGRMEDDDPLYDEAERIFMEASQ